jgi:hypothetical protein
MVACGSYLKPHVLHRRQKREVAQESRHPWSATLFTKLERDCTAGFVLMYREMLRSLLVLPHASFVQLHAELQMQSQ